MSSHPPQSDEIDLLTACPACGLHLDLSVLEPLQTISCPRCSAGVTGSSKVGPYSVIEVAGRGGMGVVFKAWDPGLNRMVAIKLLSHAQGQNDDLIQKLEQEASVTATVNHPNVVRVYSTGISAGRFYLVMELVDQGSLDDLMRKQGRVAEMQILRIAIQAAQGMQAAQKVGLLHRDIKPGNLLFSKTMDVKIVDFGLAILQEHAEVSKGELWGTPYYVAPEKLEFQPEDFRSDMYSLGASLFHALAGRPPFEAENANLVAVKRLKAQLVSIQTFAPWVSNATAYAINRMLCKDPDGRFSSYEELIQHLEYARQALAKAAASPKKASRVVLEDDGEQKAWGWVTISAFGLAVVAIIVGCVFWNQITGNSAKGKPDGKSAKSAAIKSASEISWPESVQESINGGRYPQALERLAESQFDPAWHALATYTAAVLAGEQQEAETALTRLGAEAKKLGSRPDGAFLQNLVQEVSLQKTIPTSDIGSLQRSSHEAIAPFVWGIHNLSLGDTASGVEHLREFRRITPEGSAAWISGLKTGATNLMGMAEEFEMACRKLEAEKDLKKKIAMGIELKQGPRLFRARAQMVTASIQGEMQSAQSRLSMPPGPGVYRIVNRKSTKCLQGIAGEKGLSGQVNQVSPGGGPNQRWSILTRGDQTFQIKCQASNRVMALKNKKPGEPVVKIPSKAAPEEFWKVVHVERGWFQIVSAASNLALTAGEEIVASTPTDGAASQEWQFVGIDQLHGDWRFAEVGYAPVEQLTIAPDGGTIQMKGVEGHQDNRMDSSRYLCKLATGDCTITARVVITGEQASRIRAGAMIRNNIQSNAPSMSALLAPGAGGRALVRLKAGDSVNEVQHAKLHHSWVRLVRQQRTITAALSYDGKYWTQVDKQTFPELPASVLIGLAVLSTDHTGSTAVDFTNVDIQPPTAVSKSELVFATPSTPPDAPKQ